MKSTLIAGALVALSFFSNSAKATDFDPWLGTYISKDTTFVTLKRLTLTKAKDGSIKVQGALVGFPEEVSIGEPPQNPVLTTAIKVTKTFCWASFSSKKFKPLVVIRTNGNIKDGKLTSIHYSCYMTDVDGAKVYFDGGLTREP